jgi:hypothetical protein
LCLEDACVGEIIVATTVAEIIGEAIGGAIAGTVCAITGYCSAEDDGGSSDTGSQCPIPEKPHGNRADDRPATRYKKYDKDGNFRKHGVTQNEDPTKRYTKKQIDGGTVVPVERGPRRDMLKTERDLVETEPGPDNHEPWAGSRVGQ